MTDWLDITAHELSTLRSSLSLASQVLYQCRVMALLRENLDEAHALLRDPALLQSAYERRWGGVATITNPYTPDPHEETSSAG
jgi:hypothetical protein